MIDNKYGKVIGTKSNNSTEQNLIVDMVSFYSNYDSEILNNFLMIIEEEYEKISFLASLHIKKEYRGSGKGSEFFNIYLDTCTQDTEMDFLFAKIDTPQQNNFCLQSFYEKKGFEAVYYSCGELLMVNKKQSEKMKLLLGFKSFFCYNKSYQQNSI
jgi:N-acetylglutamate synthase-like GNAT family acetyltransferase